MPVSRLITELSIPTIISMLIGSVYNMADTYFVGRLGTSATGGVGVSFALMAVIQAIGFTLGMGSGNYVSRLLGQKDNEMASHVAATGFYTALIIGALFSVAGLVFLRPLALMLGATQTILPYAESYIRILLLGVPFMMASYVLNTLLRFQGSAMYGMLGISAGALLNIGLDPLFIFTFKMGTAGAALATVISQFVSFCILLWCCTRGSNIKIMPRNFMPKWSVYKEILYTGMPSFYRQGLASISMIILNHSAGVYGDAAIAAISIVNRAFFFAFSIVLGFGQGFQPVCGFNYGAGKYDRVLQAFWFCVKLGTAVLIVLSVLGFLFAPQIVAIFRRDDPEVIQIGALALRLQSTVFPLQAWIVMCNMLMQNIGKSFKASLIAIARQGLFFIPVILVLPGIIGLLGVQISQTISDICTFILALPLGRSVVMELKSMKNREHTTVDVSVEARTMPEETI